MAGLRWILGLATGAFAVGWLFLVTAGDRFRGSLGASQNAWWKGVLPVVVAAVLLAGLIWPERRALLHVGAIAAGGVLIASIYIARETVFVASLGVLYSAAWLYVYYRSAWSPGGGG